MIANETSRETDLIDRAVAWLNERLPEQWEAERSSLQETSGPDASPRQNAVLNIRAPNRAVGTLAVEARSSLEPRAAAHLLPALAQTLRSLAGSVPVLVIAPWLSARTRELLSAQGINYIDLTGNVLVSLRNPGMFISSQGAVAQPAAGAPRTSARTRPQGRAPDPAAGRCASSLWSV